MKRSSTVISLVVVALFVITGCGSPTADLSLMESMVAGSEGDDIQTTIGWVVQEMDGHVTNWAEVETEGETIRVGYEPGMFGGKDYRGIVSFDTSGVPEDAEILGIWMYLGIHHDFRSQLPDDWSSYAARHLVVEVAPPWGFSGTPVRLATELTGYDYYTAPMARSRWVQDPVVGAVHLYNRDVNPTDFTQYINRDGLTQVRIGFETNPMAYQLEFQSGEVEASGPEEPYPQPFLYVIWR